MAFDIRTEQAGDAAAIREVHDLAFGGPGEGRLVDMLRQDAALLLSLVATQETTIVGHVAFSRIKVTGGSVEQAAALAPVAVLPAQQRHGVGSALIGAGLKELAERGEKLVFVLGAPAYYRRFGFSAEAARRFETPWPGDAFMALWLGAPLSDAVGVLHYAPAFHEL